MTTPAWYPSADQELLLRAALMPGETAERAWVRWREATGDQFDLGSLRLLPLVYRNLAAHGSDDPWMGRLKGIYRRTWFLNQALLDRTATAVGRLEAAGIPTLLLKGAGLTLAHYRDMGARPMDDADVAVPCGRALEALAVLAEDGFRAERPVSKDDLVLGHAETLAAPGGERIDLHWDVLWRAGRDELLWEAAVPAELRGIATRTLCPTDHLLQVCGHAAYWNRIHPVRWVADVHVVLRSAGPEVDWDRLVSRAAERELTLPLADALDYVRGRFGAPVPADVVPRLRGPAVRALRRVTHRVAALPPSRARSAGLLLVYLDVYRTRARVRGRRATPSGFVRSVQRHLEVEDAAELARRITRTFLRSPPRGGDAIVVPGRGRRAA